MDEQESSPSPHADGKSPAEPWHKRLSVALSLAALIVSVPMAFLNAWSFLRGPEVAVLEPRGVLLYKHPGRDSAVLAVAMRVVMTNTSTSQNDLFREAEAELRFTDDGPSFGYNGPIAAVMAPADSPAQECGPTARCILLDRLRVVEEASEEAGLIELPSGQVRSRYLSFRITTSRCTGASAICNDFGEFDRALRRISTLRPLTITIRLKFWGDGDRIVRCRVTGFDPAYIRVRGWQTQSCRPGTVSDTTFF